MEKSKSKQSSSETSLKGAKPKSSTTEISKEPSKEMKMKSSSSVSSGPSMESFTHVKEKPALQENVKHAKLMADKPVSNTKLEKKDKPKSGFPIVKLTFAAMLIGGAVYAFRKPNDFKRMVHQFAEKAKAAQETMKNNQKSSGPPKLPEFPKSKEPPKAPEFSKATKPPKPKDPLQSSSSGGKKKDKE